MPSDANPKDLIGDTKPSFHCIPATAEIHLGQVMADGEAKYGLANWRTKKVKATVYYDAARRHMAAWLDGEDTAEDSGHHHLAHAMACFAIVLDAMETGNLIDDRPTPGVAAKLLERRTKKEAAPVQEAAPVALWKRFVED